MDKLRVEGENFGIRSYETSDTESLFEAARESINEIYIDGFRPKGGGEGRRCKRRCVKKPYSYPRRTRGRRDVFFGAQCLECCAAAPAGPQISAH